MSEVGQATQFEASSCETGETVKFCDELRQILKTGLPLSLSSAARVLQDLTNAVMLGRYDTVALGGVSVAGIWTGIIDITMFSAADQCSALCSKAFGAGQFALVGVWLQFFLIFVTLGAVPLMILRFYTTEVLLFLGITADLAAVAGVWTRWSLLGVLFDLWYASTKSYYASQLIVLPDLWVDALCIFANIILNLVFIFGLGWGIKGIAISSTVLRLLRVVSYVAYCRCKRYHERTWKGWSLEEIQVWHRWKTLLKLAIPAAAGAVAEEAQFAFCTVLIGQLGPADSAAWTFMMNLLFMTMIFSESMGEATSIRMAHCLGKAQASSARRITQVGLSFCFCFGIATGLLVTLLLHPISLLISYDSQVRELMNELRFLIAPTMALCGLLMPACSILFKQGRGLIVGVTVPLSCWCLGCPCSYLLCQSQGLPGVALGLVIGYSLAGFGVCTALLSSDWVQLSQRASEVESEQPFNRA